MNKQRTTIIGKKEKSNTGGRFSDQITRYPYVFAILTLFIIITFGGVTLNKTVHFDDDIMLENISSLHSSSFNIFREALNRDAWAGTDKPFYRPVQTFFLLLIGNENQKTGSFFILLLLIHIINSFLVYILAEKITKNKIPSLFLAMLFSVHPLVTPVTSWIPALGDALLALFTLLTIISIIFFWEKQKILFLALHLTFFVLSVFTKETAIFIPLILIAYSIIFRLDYLKSVKLIFHIIAIFIWIVTVVIYFRLRFDFLQTNEIQGVLQPGLIDLFSNLRVIPELTFKFIFPFKLSLISSYSIVRTLFGIIILCAMIVPVFTVKKSRALFIFGAAWFMGFLIPTLVFVHPHFDYLEHRSYLPLIGLLIFISGLPFKAAFRYVLAGIIPVLIITSILYGKDYKNPITFYNRMVQNSGLSMTFNNRAIEKIQIGDKQGALMDCDEAIRIDPSYADAYINRANLKVSGYNDYEAAINDYNKALEFLETKIPGSYIIHKDFQDVYNNRGLMKSNMGDISGAMQDYNAAIEMDSSYAEAYNNRALLKGEKVNDTSGAMIDFNKAIELNPQYTQAYNNRGVLKEIRFKDLKGAINDYTMAISINKEYADAYFNRGMCYFSLNQAEQACTDMNIAAGKGHQVAVKIFNERCQ